MRLFDNLSTRRAQGRTSVRIPVNGKKKHRAEKLSIAHMAFEMPPAGEAEPDADATAAPVLSLTAIMAIERETVIGIFVGQGKSAGSLAVT